MDPVTQLLQDIQSSDATFQEESGASLSTLTVDIANLERSLADGESDIEQIFKEGAEEIDALASKLESE